MILHAWSPEPAAAPRQAETWAALPALAAAAGGAIVSVPTPATDPLAYSRALTAAWAIGQQGADLIVLEGDKIPTPEQLRGLVACPHLLCAQAYPLYSCTTGLPAPIYAMGEDRGDAGVRWLAPGEEWADVGGLGVLRIRARLLRAAPPPAGQPYGADFDRRVLGPLTLLYARIHVHWPAAAHHHGA